MEKKLKCFEQYQNLCHHSRNTLVIIQFVQKRIEDSLEFIFSNCDVDDDKIREIFKDVAALESAIGSTKISLESIMKEWKEIIDEIRIVIENNKEYSVSYKPMVK